MTEQEKQEFWKKQTLFTMSDIIRASNGTILLKPDAMNRIASEYQITLAKGKIYSLREARDIILNEEIKRREHPLESANEEKEQTLSDAALKVVSYFRIVPSSKKNNNLFLAKELNRIFPRTKPSEIIAAIKAAKEQGLIDNAEDVIKEYHNQLGLRALAVNIEKFQMNIKDETELVNKISGFIFNNYKHGYSYGQLNFTLQKSSISSEMKEKVQARFYELLMPELVQRYQATKYRGSLLAKDILEHYGDFDMNRIFAILDVSTNGLDIDKVRFESYRIEDEPFIRDILIDGNKNRLPAEQIAAQLKEVSSEYPMDFIIRTIRDMQAMHLILPYDGIIKSLNNPQKQVEETEDLHPVVSGRFQLSPEGEFEETGLQPVETTAEIRPVESKPVSVGKRHKIIKREKAITAPDKKAVIAGLIVAAGAISTAVLTSIFGVSPVEAARNTAASIASFVTGNAFLSQVIPTTVTLVQNLSVFGLATAGTVAWLRRRKAKQKEQRKQEIREVLEEVNREYEEAERGGKTR